MELGWGLLALICFAAALAWFWQDSLRARERANAVAVDACERLHLQFLDGTVAFARLAFVRDVGRLRLRRTYVFDYTTNSVERRQGFVVLVGDRVESLGYEGGRPMRAVEPGESPRPAEVLQLDNWRGSGETGAAKPDNDHESRRAND